MPVFHAELQVAGRREPLDTFGLHLNQPTDYLGRPNGTVRVWPLRVTFTGPAALVQYYLEWGLDSYMRRSGRIVAYEEGKVCWRLAFYDAWCTLHCTTFATGNDEAAFQVELRLSPAAVEVNGVHVEQHTDLWWEKDAATRLKVLTKPAALLPSLALAAALKPPIPPPVAAPPLSLLTGAPLAPKPPRGILTRKDKPKYGPTISKWYEKGGSIEILENGNWKYTDWEHNSVEYEGDEPNFNDYARQQVDIENMTGDCTTDFTAANKTASLGRKLPDNTWHHKQNARTMQEVNTIIHDRFTHYGARHVLKIAKAMPTKLTKRPKLS